MGRRTGSPAAGLDGFDLAILYILERDNTTPQRTIGEAVNLSAAAVQRRIRRMEEDGGDPSQCGHCRPGLRRAPAHGSGGGRRGKRAGRPA
ncbi:Lrp/AsnC family transcriptional regulator [Azospirillum sp. INR13]|uniref:Lrp/AsnC family transcriptional regulator n=1 Tax=Azospirillum sp. INR13 TaxID=2596919 RepID=UPI00351C0642